MTQWMVALCQAMRAEDPTFQYQRKLMDGGTTEATSYDLYGYETGAACVALGNYHNAGRGNRVAPETIHLGDIEGLVRLLLRMSETSPRYETYLPDLLKRYDRLGKEAGPALRRSARTRPSRPAAESEGPSENGGSARRRRGVRAPTLHAPTLRAPALPRITRPRRRGRGGSSGAEV
jgi:endoglucanase